MSVYSLLSNLRSLGVEQSAGVDRERPGGARLDWEPGAFAPRERGPPGDSAAVACERSRLREQAAPRRARH